MRLSLVYLRRTSSRAPGEAVGHGRGFIRREAARRVVVFVGWSLWGVKFPLTGRLRFSWWHVGVALADLYFMDVWVCARKDLYIWVVVDGLKSPDHVRLVFPYNVRFVIVVVWLRIYFCLWLHACWSRDCFWLLDGITSMFSLYSRLYPTDLISKYLSVTCYTGFTCQYLYVTFSSFNLSSWYLKLTVSII